MKRLRVRRRLAEEKYYYQTHGKTAIEAAVAKDAEDEREAAAAKDADGEGTKRQQRQRRRGGGGNGGGSGKGGGGGGTEGGLSRFAVVSSNKL